MLFAEPAEPADPYDDPGQPAQWAWRYGYFELLYTPASKTLALAKGPKYSIHGGKRCCRYCRGSGYLPWPERTAPDTTTPCPTCPAYRTLFKHLPLWPVGFFGRLRHRRSAGNRPTPYDSPAPGPDSDYNGEPPF
ncbi:hypothetical protein [Streptomyces sp. NPDC015350]|uniref:hypothetical protein n=1 Tax=Streptomyces sp. NPDC015350 TaxID=3364955 RepID=UPI0037003AEB